jgi:predicted metal-dependent phosphoesterase TrpH
MAPDEDLLGFEEDEAEEKEEEVLFGLEEEAKKRKKGKPKDDFDELFDDAEEQGEDIYANEDFERYDPGVTD